SETLPPTQITRMRDELASRSDQIAQTDLFAVQCRNLKRVHDAGMILGLGTDANADIGWGVHLELVDMVSCGLTPAEAITAGTRTSAEILRLHQLGTVSPGKDADFIVLEANPLESITNTRAINAVYLRGAPLDRAAMRRALSMEPVK